MGFEFDTHSTGESSRCVMSNCWSSDTFLPRPCLDRQGIAAFARGRFWVGWRGRRVWRDAAVLRRPLFTLPTLARRKGRSVLESTPTRSVWCLERAYGDGRLGRFRRHRPFQRTDRSTSPRTSSRPRSNVRCRALSRRSLGPGGSSYVLPVLEVVRLSGWGRPKPRRLLACASYRRRPACAEAGLAVNRERVCRNLLAATTAKTLVVPA